MVFGRKPEDSNSATDRYSALPAGKKEVYKVIDGDTNTRVTVRTGHGDQKVMTPITAEAVRDHLNAEDRKSR